MEQPPLGVMPKKKGLEKFIPLGLVLILVLAFVIYQTFGARQLSDALPEGTNTITFSDTGVMEKFLLSHYSLLAQPRQRVNDVTILESVKFPTEDGQAALASAPNTSGTILGILHGNGNFEPVLSDGTEKVDLHIIKGGLVVYTVLSRPVTWSGTESEAPPEAASADEPDAEGSATGPIESGVDYKLTSGPGSSMISGGTLYTFDLANGTEPRSLGAGKNPRVLSGGAIVALSSEGIVRIDSASGARTVLFQYPGGDAVGSALSADGSVALLHSEGNSISNVYTVSNNSASLIGSIVSLVPTYGATFADNAHIFLRTDRDNVSLYMIPEDTASLKPPTAHLSIIAPQ